MRREDAATFSHVTRETIRSGDQEKIAGLSVAEAVRDYDSRHYREELSPLHGLSHLLAAGLMQPGNMLNYAQAAQDRPLYQAGFEAEYIAAIYQSVLNNSARIDELEALPDDFQNKMMKMTIDGEVQKIQSVTERFIKSNLNTPPSSRNAHGKAMHHYLKYLQNEGIIQPKEEGMRREWTVDKDRLWRPDEEELEFHYKKAMELCRNFKTKNVMYPGFLIDMLGDLPLAVFSIDNTSKEDRQHREERAELRQAMYGVGAPDVNKTRG